MLSIGKLVPGAEDYYIRCVAGGVEEYYIGSGEAPGYWTGEGAPDLGLSGEVDPDQLRAILAGRHPLTGEALVDTAAGRRVAGYDLTFSAPKSVSLLYGLTDEEIAASVRTCHDRAVGEALGYIADHALYGRRGHGGAELIGTDGVIAAAFRHRTSRAGDPQLHTHVLVANVVHGSDAKWSAPWASLLYHHGRTAGFVYQAALRHELGRSLGVSFTPVVNGAAEVAGVDKDLVRAFSTRRAEIEARLANLGVDSAKAAQVATLDTRVPKASLGEKAPVTFPSLADTWRARATGLGHDPDRLAGLVGPPRFLDLSDGAVFTIADELVSPGGLTEKVSTFSRRDIVRAVAERFPDGADLRVIDHTVGRVLASHEVVALGRIGHGAEERLTTLELLAIEDRLVERATAGKGKGTAVVDPDVVKTVIAGHPTLSDEQRAMVARLTCSGDSVQVVVGAAGSGKTFALRVARESWERSGYRVRGAALAARAAGELHDGSGIASSTLASLDRRLSNGEARFGPGDVLVVDEAGMVGTRMLVRVTEGVTASGGSVVLVGDHRQLPEIETGGAFGSLARELGAIELHENRRQVSAWERESLAQLRDGDVGVAVHALDSNGRVHEYDSMARARVALVTDWATATKDEPFHTARMYGLRRSDVDALNVEARRQLRRDHRLGPDIYTSASGMGFARDEEVLCLRNDSFLGVVNGTSGKVVSAQAGCLTLVGPRGTVHIDEHYIGAGHLTYGYASTIHKSQGATVDRAFVLGTASLYRESGYVALSRARQSSDLYVVNGAFETGLVRDGEVSHGPVEPTRARGLTESLSVSRAKTMARDEFETVNPHSTPTTYSPVTMPAHLALWDATNAARRDPPAYITDTIGNRPDDLRQAKAWENAATSIHYYRARSGFDGPHSLGPMPDDNLTRMAYRRALNSIAEYERQRTCERDLRPPGRDLGLSR